MRDADEDEELEWTVLTTPGPWSAAHPHWSKVLEIISCRPHTFAAPLCSQWSRVTHEYCTPRHTQLVDLSTVQLLAQASPCTLAHQQT